MSKVIVLLAILAVALSPFSAEAQGTTSRPPVTDVNYANCAQEPDGAFLVHPWDCTRYIRCTHQKAQDMPCPACVVNPVTCPNGWLHWNAAKTVCDWVNEAGCTSNGGPSTTPVNPGPTTTQAPNPTSTQAPNPTTTQAPNPTPTQDPNPPTPAPGPDCDPDDCKIVGTCLTYTYCHRLNLNSNGPIGGTGTLVTRSCGKLGTDQLYFNPEITGTHPWDIHGHCDLWNNLSQQVKDRYLLDPDCAVCDYNPVDICSADYIYKHEEPKGSKTWVEDMLSCSPGLVFDKDRLTCADPCTVTVQTASGVVQCGNHLSLPC